MAKSKRLQQRVLASAQLVRGEDDDLVTWYETIPKGERTQAMKDTLRAALGFKPPAAADELAVVREELRIVRTRLNELESTAPNGSSHPVDMQQMTALQQEWERWTRELVESLPTYVQSAVAQAMNGQPATESVVESTPRLAQQEVEQRKTKLKKASW